MRPPERPEPSPQELAAGQGRRERVERERAEDATDEAEAREHERRAEQAGYLREKLRDQAESERPT